MQKKMGWRFWCALLIFGLTGQVAWTVENMYFNVFIYKMFHASAAQISLMVSASAVSAALTTLLMGALSDKIGRRRLLICGGYVLWGISILGFVLVRADVLAPIAGSMAGAFSLGVTLTILLDCVMTFFGSTANDAAYNAWLTDWGDSSNRGRIEGLNAMMPLLALLMVFGGFMGFDLDRAESWTTIFSIIGSVVLVIGALGCVLVKDAPGIRPSANSYRETLVYSFRPSTLRENRLLYAVLGCFAVFGISIQVFMPYLILYYEQSLGMSNYVLVMVPAILIASVVTAFYGRLYDMLGFKGSILPAIGMLFAGYAVLFFVRSTVPVFFGSLLMMMGYLTGITVFGAMIRDNTPENRAGEFQGIRIIAQVLVPGVIGPAIGAFVLRDAQQILNQDGTTSFLPHRGIWAAALVVLVLTWLALTLVFRMMRTGHHELWSEAGEVVRAGGEGWTRHPRPQMKREKWMMLGAEWTLNERSIRMPYPPQSLLSGYDGRIGAKLVYETHFAIPKEFDLARVILHFGAVDQIAEVYVNDSRVGRHEGGYLPFEFDITQQLRRDGKNTLRVLVTDALDHTYPYGKQCKKRGGMWYTPVSGIWQSVWLENVPENYVRRIRMTPDLKGVEIELDAPCDGFEVEVGLENGEKQKWSFSGSKGRIELKQPVLWTPEHPYLYPVVIRAGEDRLESYFALRTISIEERGGINRVCLNGEPVFLHGVLDQGYFSDGIYLPASEAEYERDILRMKELGLNLLRKHIKIEPDCFYEACDRLGMLVMQDMVNNGSYNFIRDTALPTIGMKRKKDDSGGLKSKRRQIFLAHAQETLDLLYNHPSVIAYTIFNEGWGQFCADEVYRTLKRQDPSRLMDATSGWFAQKESDFDSEHIYFRIAKMQPKRRSLLVSECGGYAMPTPGHIYSKYNSYGYGSCGDKTAFTAQITQMYEKMILPGIAGGICGCVYTQLSDVEDEINGFYTYDRRVCKVDAAQIRQLSQQLYAQMEKAAH